LEEIFSILSSIRAFTGILKEHKETIGKKLQTLAKAWPKSRFYVNCKKKLIRLLKSWNIKVEFSKGPSIKPSPASAKPDEENEKVSTKSKKKKKKSQEELKNKKALKLQQARAQENSDIPSFSDLVQDTLNTEAIEGSKRKANDDGSKPKKKKTK